MRESFTQVMNPNRKNSFSSSFNFKPENFEKHSRLELKYWKEDWFLKKHVMSSAKSLKHLNRKCESIE